MPIYEITAPNGRTYEIEGPSGASKEDAVRALLAKFPEAGKKPPEPTMGGYVQESLKAIPRGFVGGLESAALGAAALLPGDTETGFEKTAREGIKGLAERFKPSVAAGYEEAIPVKLAEAVGSMGTLLIPGGAAGLAAKGLGAAQGAQRVAQLAATTPVAGAMGAGEARERAVAAGATPEQIQTATAAGVVPGLAEMLPVERIFRRMPDELKGGILERVKRALVTGGFEGAQEAASAVAQNLIAKGVYKPSQELIEGVGEQAAYGVGAGAIVQFLVDAVAGRRAPPKGAAERAQRLEEERTAAEKQAVVDAFNALPGEVTADKVAAADQKIEAIKADLKTLGKQQRGGSPEANALRQEIRKLQQIKKLGEYGGTQTDLFGEVGGGFTPLTARPEAATEQDKQQFLTNYRRALNDLEQISAQKAQAEEMNNQAAISYFGRLEQQRKAALDAFEEQGKKLGVSEDELSVASRGVVGQLQSLRNRQKTLNSKGNYDEAAALQPRIETLEQQLAETTGTPLEREAGQRAERQAELFAEEMEAKPYPSVAPKVAQPEVPPEVAAKLEQLQGQRAQLVDQKKTTSGARAKYIQNQIDALDQDINALQQQGVVPAEYVSGAVFGEQALEQLTEAQEARLQQARDVFNTQRQQRQQEAEAEEVGTQAEKAAREAPLEAIFAASRRPLKEKAPVRALLQKYQSEIDSGQLTVGPSIMQVTNPRLDAYLARPENSTAKFLGLDTYDSFAGPVDLTNPEQAQTALRDIDDRISTLTNQRNTVFPNRELVKDGALTADGKKLVGVEATLRELQRLRSIAQQTLQSEQLSPAETALSEEASKALETATTVPEASEVTGPPSLFAPAEGSKTKAAITEKGITEANKQAERRNNALFEYGNIIDSLRKGEFTGSTRQADQRQALNYAAEITDAAVREAELRRIEATGKKLTTVEKVKLAEQIRAKLDQLVKRAAPIKQQNAMENALAKARAAAEAKIQEAVARNAPQSEMTPLLKYEQSLRQRQDVIERGMTISDTRTGELADIKRFTEDAIQNTALRGVRKKAIKVKPMKPLPPQEPKKPAVKEKTPEQIAAQQQRIEARRKRSEERQQRKKVAEAKQTETAKNAQAKMRARVEQQFDLVAETQAAIAAEEKRIEDQLKGEWLASDIAKNVYGEDPLYNSMLSDIEYAEGLTPKQREKIEAQVRKAAAEYRNNFAESIIRTEKHKRRLTRDNAALQALKKDLKIFEDYLKQLTEQENALRTEAQLKPLKQQVQGYLRRFENLVNNGKARDEAVGKKASAQVISAKDSLQELERAQAEQTEPVIKYTPREEKPAPRAPKLKTAKAQAKARRELLGMERREGVRRPTKLRTGVTEDTAQFPDEPDYRDASADDTGVDAGEAKTVADRVQKALPEGIKFVYAPTLVDAPAAFKKALERSGRTAAKGAVMPDGTVIVIGEAHKSTADLQETIAHELIGHYGADMVLGKDGVQALTDKLFGRGLDHVAEVAVGLGVYPDVASARIALGASKPQVNMTRRRLLQAAGAAIAKPVMPLDVSKAFEITDPKAALDDLYDAWRKADKWVKKIVKMLPSSLQEEAKDVLHTTLYRIGGENFYEAWTNQGEDWVTASLIEEAVEKEGVKTLTANIKRAYDVAAADIAALVKPQASKQETKETAATQDFSDAFKTTFVRELIARAAEGRRVAPTFAEKVKTFIRDMVGAVRGWFRNSGLSDLAKQDTKQIQALISRAERELKNSRPGVYISPDGNAVFRDGASSDLDWMSDTSKEVLQRVVAQEKSAIDTVKGNVLGLTGVTQFIDRTAPFLAALQKGVATKKISELEASQARYYLVAHDKRMNFTRNVAANGPLELKKFTEGAANYWMVQNKEGKDNPTLLKMFKALGESGMNADEAGRVFTLWLAAQRVKNEGIGVEALNYGKDKDGQPLLTAEKLRGVEKDVASQPKIAAAFEKARKEYNAYNAGLIDFAVQAGRISPEVAADLKRKKDYIPFYRQMGGEVKLFIGSEGAPITIGNLKDQPYLNELVGGDKPIQDVFTSSIQNTHMLTDMALRNITTKNVVYTLRKLGMLEAGRGGMVVRPKAGPASPLTIRFMENGVEKHAIVKTEGTIFEDIPAELLVKGLEGVKTTFPAALQLLGAPAKLLRRFVVLNPLYPVRQIMRDSLSAYGTSGADFNPIFDPVRNVVKAMIKKSPSAKELEERGLLGGQLLAGEGLEGMSTILRGVTGGKGNLSTALAWLESKSMYADVGTRVSAYDSYKRMGFNDLDAFLATNDIIDFNRRGMSPSVYFANTLIPFFNTQLQSLNVTYRAARGRMPYEERLDIKNKFVRRGIGMAVMTMLYAALMEDDEAYKNATPEQRLANWFVRVPGLDEPVRIPIPFEYGLLFKAIPEAVVNVAFGTDEGAPIAKGLATLAWQSVPNLTPQVGKPFIELATGKDLFTGADVETARMQRLDPTERFKDDTTELAKVLSSVGQGVLSPVQIDQFVRGVGTQLAVAVMSAANPILRDPNTPPSPEMKASKLPVVGSLMQPNDGNRVIDYVYEQMGKAEQARNTYNKLMEEGRDAEAERYINREAGRIALSDSVADFRKEMKDIRDAEEAIKRDPDMTSEQKRDELTELRKLKLQIAADYRDIIRQSSE